MEKTKTLLTDQIKENKKAFEEECFPLKIVNKEFAKREKELQEKKANDLLHAELIFFFKFNDQFFLIPDDITGRIIQGLGNKVFTKTFRIEVPHYGFKESDKGLPFKVVSFINYGDTKMYKCTGEIFGEKVVVYIDKEREMELGSSVNLEPIIPETQIYENELNIRLY